MSTVGSQEIGKLLGIHFKNFQKFRHFLDGFPEPLEFNKKTGYVYDKAAVEAWAKANDIKQAVAAARWRYNHPADEISPFNQRARAFLSRPMVRI